MFLNDWKEGSTAAKVLVLPSIPKPFLPLPNSDPYTNTLAVFPDASSSVWKVGWAPTVAAS